MRVESISKRPGKRNRSGNTPPKKDNCRQKISKKKSRAKALL